MGCWSCLEPGTGGGGTEGGGPCFSGLDRLPPVCLLSRVSSPLAACGEAGEA